MWSFLSIIFWQMACAAVCAFVAFQFKHDSNLILAALVGALMGGLVWVIVNFNRSRHYLDWLRAGDVSDEPKLRGIWVEAFDRTRRLLREQKKLLQASNQRLEDFLAAIQASPNGVVLLDKNGKIEWCNLTAASHYGLNPTADISQHIGNLVRDPSFATYFASGEYANKVTIAGKNNANSQSSRLAVHIHPYGQGKKLLLSNDVTAIEAAEFMRRDFVANVSHEIRTPLTVLSGFIETLQTLSLDEVDRAKYLDLMQHQSLRIQALVSDLLTLSKLEGSPAPVTDVWIDIDALVATCKLEADALRTELRGKLHSCTNDVTSNEKQVLFFDIQPDIQLAGSQTELLSAMCNLVNNAVRYTPANGSIRVSFQALDWGGAVFSVNDSGLGIPSEHLPRLTERFYRVDASRSRETGGTGLGLSIVKHVVQRHGGELQISSTFGKGSTFSFTLPAYRVRLKKNSVASSA